MNVTLQHLTKRFPARGKKGEDVIAVNAANVEIKDGELLGLLGPSLYISDTHIEHLRETARREKQDEERICRETDASTTMEGLYIKVEENGEVTERVKFVRQSFLQTVEQSNSHWLERPIIPNGIICSVADLFAPTLCTKDGE